MTIIDTATWRHLIDDECGIDYIESNGRENANVTVYLDPSEDGSLHLQFDARPDVRVAINLTHRLTLAAPAGSARGWVSHDTIDTTAGVVSTRADGAQVTITVSEGDEGDGSDLVYSIVADASVQVSFDIDDVYGKPLPLIAVSTDREEVAA